MHDFLIGDDLKLLAFAEVNVGAGGVETSFRLTVTIFDDNWNVASMAQEVVDCGPGQTIPITESTIHDTITTEDFYYHGVVKLEWYDVIMGGWETLAIDYWDWWYL